MEKVSIILTTYNRLGYLKDCMDSLLENTICDYQLIIADDASTDGTQDYLKELVASNNKIAITLLLSKVRAGVSSSRNQGIIRSNGDIVALIDDDNLFTKGWLTETVSVIKAFPKVGGVTVYRPLWEIIDDPELLSPLDLYEAENDGVKCMIIKYLGGGLVMRKSVWQKVGPFSHTDPRSGIGRYSDRIRKSGYLLARTRRPVVESMDIGHHPKCRKFTDFKEYTDSISPEEQREMEFYNDRKREILEFNEKHGLNKEGLVVEL